MALKSVQKLSIVSIEWLHCKDLLPLIFEWLRIPRQFAFFTMPFQRKNSALGLLGSHFLFVRTKLAPVTKVRVLKIDAGWVSLPLVYVSLTSGSGVAGVSIATVAFCKLTRATRQPAKCFVDRTELLGDGHTSDLFSRKSFAGFYEKKEGSQMYPWEKWFALSLWFYCM